MISITDIMHETLFVVVKIGAPLMILALVIGLIVSIFQALTQIQEQTLTFVPKFFAILVCLWLMGPFIQNTLVQFMSHIFERIKES
jgi:flagellar biosynthetic protein FliQ